MHAPFYFLLPLGLTKPLVLPGVDKKPWHKNSCIFGNGLAVAKLKKQEIFIKVINQLHFCNRRMLLVYQ